MTPVVAERAVWIDCAGDRLLGIFSEAAAETSHRAAVLVAVGGPQYRVGSHRQFTLLARRLAGAGHCCLRFDYRGMGDSSGAPRPFTEVDIDINAAIDALRRESGASRVVVWGLCDAASAALMFAAGRPDVAGLVLVNPWLRDDVSYAATTLKHYYAGRLLQSAFWRKLVNGKMDWRASLKSFAQHALAVLRRGEPPPQTEVVPFQTRMASRLRDFQGQVLLALSGNDLTAKEFIEAARSDARWKGLLERPNITRCALPEADHTFSTARWRSWLEERTLEWLVRAGQSRPESHAPRL